MPTSTLSEIEALVARGHTEIRRDPAASEKTLALAVRMAKREGATSQLGKATGLLGAVRLEQWRHADALALFRRARRLHGSAGDHLREVEMVRLVGLVHMQTGDFRKALAALSECNRLHDEHAISSGREYVLCDLGTLHDAMGDMARAGMFYRKALEEGRREKNNPHLSVILHNLSAMYVKLGLLDEARAHAREGLKRNREQGDIVGCCLSHSRLSQIARLDNDLREAAAHAEKTLRLAEQAGLDRLRFIAYDHGISCALAAGEIERAGELFQTLRSVRYPKEDQLAQLRLLHLEGTLRARRGEHPAAQRTLVRALKLARTLSDAWTEGEVLDELRRVAAAEKNTAAALRYTEQLLDLRTAMRRSENERAVALLRDVMRVAEEERRTEAERAARRVLEEEMERKGRETAAMALALADLSAAMGEIADELQAFARDGDEQSRRKLQGFARRLRSRASVEEAWRRFLTAFEEQDPSFSQELRRRAPSVSGTEVRVATLLRIGLSTKEIASTIGVAEPSVQTYRHRLRRKLGLDGGTNLVVFLRSFSN